MLTEPAITLQDVTRTFGDVDALTGLSFEVPVGTVTVMLGPNGAGKTTCLRMITGALKPDQGTVVTLGMNPSGDDGPDVRLRCGVVSAKPSLYDRLTGWDNLRYAADMLDIQNKDAMRESADRFGILHALDQKVGGYSTGMKTRLALARAVLHDPELLLLDEPTSGLDPESSVAVLRLINELAKGGRTVLMCTHLLAEAEGIADQVVFLGAGKAVTVGPPDQLVGRFWPHPEVAVRATPLEPLQTLIGTNGVTDVTPTGMDTAMLTITDFADMPQIIKSLADLNVDLYRIDPRVRTLEELYMAVQQEHLVATADGAIISTEEAA